MSVNPVVKSAMLKSLASIAAQVAARWHDPIPPPLDWQRVVEFAVFGLVQAQINTHWQRLLEDLFPTRRPQLNELDERSFSDRPLPPSPRVSGISWPNVIGKLLLDQTVGLFIMNAVFLVCTNAVRLQSAALVYEAVSSRISDVIRAAWKLWPWVSLLNFLYVPVEKRVLVASCVGFGWNMYLAFTVMAKDGN
ncbi:Mpv17/PMP22 family protein [Colletotrichum higginsianum IMI 349063]|uniref:Mpv17/PMP22 family protein n=2 Tax=Colletotrichum higginsianum TaxID=80884 RepID=A0A1B7Y864_COLHI|nr:Mpv17/PMP22 family protein [Colletotrichum higginsianum IMI 349063]OBR08128.1 Mpv17/PMP22 family protein [Colletotrichum higginsianum IMI 349063]